MVALGEIEREGGRQGGRQRESVCVSECVCVTRVWGTLLMVRAYW